jgi:hypothetical protein
MSYTWFQQNDYEISISKSLKKNTMGMNMHKIIKLIGKNQSKEPNEDCNS